MKPEQSNQWVLLPGRADTGGTAAERTVRRITEWDGRTVGVVRHRGAEWVAQWYPKNGHWIVLQHVSQVDVYGRPV
jgi:hypothetical protein